MRALTIFAAAVALLALGSAAADECPQAGLSDPFRTYSDCPAYAQCSTAMCQCIGSENDLNPDTCFKTVGADMDCNATTTCLTDYQRCIMAIAAMGDEPLCNWTASEFHDSLLTLVATGFEGSDYQLSCQRRMCQVRNGTCGDVDVCVSPLDSENSTSIVAANYSIKITFRLSGDWEAVLNDTVALAELEAALTADLAEMLGIDAMYIIIFRLSSGSLIVEFGVLDAAPVNAATLLATIKAAVDSGSVAWLTTTKSAYNRKYPGATFGVEELIVDEVGGSTTEEASNSNSNSNSQASSVSSNPTDSSDSGKTDETTSGSASFVSIAAAVAVSAVALAL